MGEPGREGDARAGLDYYEAVPYLLVMESVQRDGRWVRRAEYPELPGCAAEAHSALEALRELETERRRVLRGLWDAESRSRSRASPCAVPGRRSARRLAPLDSDLQFVPGCGASAGEATTAGSP